MMNLVEITSDIDNFNVGNTFRCSPDKCYMFVSSPTSSLTIIHVNIRSIKKNIDQFLAVLSMITFQCDLIVFTECWLIKTNKLPTIDGYLSFATSNNISQNDGVVIYWKKNLATTLSEPTFRDGNCLLCTIGNTAIVSIYRSPSYSNIDNFLNSIQALMISLKSFQNIAIIGDLNVNIGEGSVDRHLQQYLTTMASFGLLPTHTLPTRKESCLDHILLKCNVPATTLVLDTAVTDHYPTLLCLSCKHISNYTNSLVRYVTKLDYVEIQKEIQLTDFSEVLSITDANMAADKFIAIINVIMKNHSKLIKIPRSKRNIKPWITPGLIRCIKNRDKLHFKQKKNPNNVNIKITYLRYRNFLTGLLRRIKLEYERNELRKAKNDPKATWRAIRKITNTVSNHDQPTELLKTDVRSSLNKVNSYFVNVGRNLANDIKPPNYCPPLSQKYLPKTSISNSLGIISTNESQVLNIIQGLRGNCATGCDGIPAKLIKDSRLILAPSIAHICNLSFESGVFPNAFKKALVSPIFKSGDRHEVSNYRPISILTSLSKILERILNINLTNFLNKYNVIARNQFGFRSGVSTEDAVVSLTDAIVRRIDKKHKCYAIFLDLSKAFDTVSVPKLVSKMENAGVRGNSLAIFNDYLRNRVQCVKIGDNVSSENPIDIGVPQGSILGPTLFQIYVNDLCNLSIPFCDIFTYADDTALVVHGKSWLEAKSNAEKSLEIVMDWLSLNLLTLNLQKTKFIRFSIAGSIKPPLDSCLIRAHTCSGITTNCNCLSIDMVANLKYLGIHIDERLDWKTHIENTSKRCRKLMYLFRGLRQVADMDLLKMIYITLCQSILTYCIPVWGGTHKTTLIFLERSQRAVLKVMASKCIDYPTSKLYHECGVLTIRQLYIQKIVTRKHSSLIFDPHIASRRQSYPVCTLPQSRTVFATRQYNFRSCSLYNKTNKILSIFSLNKYDVRNMVINWLQDRSYDDTEQLMISLK